MSEHRNKVAAAAGAAVIAVGGVAHFSGAFRSTADDLVRGPGRVIDDVPLPPPPRDPARPPVGAVEPATDDLVGEGTNDALAKDIICFAYDNFVEYGVFSAPSEIDFINAVAEELAPAGSQLSVRIKANSLYETLNDPEADLEDVAIELGCF